MTRNDINVTFTTNVRRILKDRNISQVELAVKMGIKPAGIAKLLSENANPTLARLEDVAKALEVPVIELLRESGPYLQAHTIKDCLETVRLALFKDTNSDK